MHKVKGFRMPMTFKQYLAKNKEPKTTKKKRRHSPTSGLIAGYYWGYDHPHNSQSGGDVSDSGSAFWSSDTGTDFPQGVENEEDLDLEKDELENVEQGEDEIDQEPVKPEDPNKQGAIRFVKGAHLVYKRKTDEGTFEELWIYNISKRRGEHEIRKDILAGTDIPIDKTASEDNTQSYTTWTAGNAQMIKIEGLPN